MFGNHSIRRLSTGILLSVALCIVVFELALVHYRYTGLIQTQNGEEVVERSSYPYPMFSDEWSAVVLVRYSIDTGKLPLVNPLNHDAPFLNLLAPFFYILAGIFFVLNLSPLTGWPLLTIASGTFVCFALYATSRSIGIGRSASLVALLSVPFITNGANLPGIWFLLPYIPSMALFFAMLACMSRGRGKPTLVAAFFAVLFYPPMIVFVVPALVARYASEMRSVLSRSRRAFLAIGAVILAFLGYITYIFGASKLMGHILADLYHANLDGGIPDYNVIFIVPLVLLPFAALGAYRLAVHKRYHILAPLAVGVAYWVFYAYFVNVVIIEYPRVVVVTSLLIILSAGVGIDEVFLFMGRRYPALAAFGARGFLAALVVIGFSILAISYLPQTSWSKLVLHLSADPSTSPLVPSTPVNHYLAPDDLALWKGISGANFVAPPWKGLVIGAATGNYPLESKPSFLTVDILSYGTFVSVDCAKKRFLAEEHLVTYVYSTPFSCPSFADIGSSSEGLHLYQFSSPTPSVE